MLVRIVNDVGAISIDENIIFDAVNDIIRSFPKNHLKLGKDNKTNRVIEMRNDGVFIHIEYVVRFGVSISEVANRTIDSLQTLVREQLELDLSNIEVAITGIQTNKGILERNILYNLRSGLVFWDE